MTTLDTYSLTRQILQNNEHIATEFMFFDNELQNYGITGYEAGDKDMYETISF